MKFLPLVWRNLLRRKVRTIFTLLSIFVAFVLFGILMAMRVRLQRWASTLAGADRLMVIDKISLIQPLPSSYEQTRMRSVEGVKTVTHANWFGGYYQEPKNQFANMAVEPDSWLRMYPEFELPEDQKKAWLADRTGAIVGAETAKRFGWKVGDRIPLQGDDLPAARRRRRGSSRSRRHLRLAEKGADKTQLLLPLRLSERGGHATSGFARPGRLVRHQSRRPVALGRRRGDASTRCSRTRRPKPRQRPRRRSSSGFAKQIGNIGIIMHAIVAAAIFTILLVTANTMAQSVRERTNELAVLKTLGFSDGRVLRDGPARVVPHRRRRRRRWAWRSRGCSSHGAIRPAASCRSSISRPRDVVARRGARARCSACSRGRCRRSQASRLRIVDALRRN